MNRKNLTAAVLAGVAGIAGIASTAQAVNLNPDGLGEVLVYPYYTSNDGNQTLLTIVNTTSEAKAVKVRFLEGYNSREVLDFNLYMSEFDVWVGAIADGGDLGYADQAGVPHLVVPDTSCTVPYLYGMGVDAGLNFGLQAFLDYEYTGDNEDGGPTDISRAAEGYFEVIEMGVLTNNDALAKGDLYEDSPARMGSADAATHELVEDEETGETMSMPADCELLVDNWTTYIGNVTRPDDLSGWWADQADDDGQIEYAYTDDIDSDFDSKLIWSTEENSGGLFGSAAVVNVAKGTMFSYDAKAIQGFDNSDDGIHFEPGTINPSLDDGNQHTAYRGQRDPNTNVVSVVPLTYARGVDAVSAVFMHDTLANQFTIQEDINAGTEWVMTFPTKSWYVDPLRVGGFVFYTPDPDDEGCNGWDPGEPNPYVPPNYTTGSGTGENEGGWAPGDDDPTYGDLDWSLCTPIKNSELTDPAAPFTELFDGEACEVVSLRTWDREESPTIEGGVIIPPIVSPAPPLPERPGEAPFELCYEVNVLRFGEVSVFGTESDLLLSVSDTPDAGWGRVTFGGEDGEDTCVACADDDETELHQDSNGLRGLPVTGFAAEQYTNGVLAGGVLANYGGLFQHKGSVLIDECTLGDDICVSDD